MRLFVVVASLVLFTTALADAGEKRSSRKRRKRDDVAVTDDVRPRRQRGQSFGLPWDGYLRHATRFRMKKGVYIRRPHRAYGTRSAVDYTRDAIRETIELHPRVHRLAIGDFSAKRGGQISDHHSHQSGRDVDIGLFYKKPPRGYPNAFANGTTKNLDTRAMWTLLAKLAWTAKRDGGVQVIYLDYDVQKIIYEAARKRGVSKKRLGRVFQYPRGNWSRKGIVRHYRNHANHIHVRYKCSKRDPGCR